MPGEHLRNKAGPRHGQRIIGLTQRADIAYFTHTQAMQSVTASISSQTGTGTITPLSSTGAMTTKLDQDIETLVSKPPLWIKALWSY